MDDKIYTITLADGSTIENLTLNGSTYISKEPVTKKEFEGNCEPLKISDGTTTETHEHTALIHVLQEDDGYHIAFRDIPPDEIALRQIRSDIEYLAMMTDNTL